MKNEVVKLGLAGSAHVKVTHVTCDFCRVATYRCRDGAALALFEGAARRGWRLSRRGDMDACPSCAAAGGLGRAVCEMAQRELFPGGER